MALLTCKKHSPVEMQFGYGNFGGGGNTFEGNVPGSSPAPNKVYQVNIQVINPLQ